MHIVPVFLSALSGATVTFAKAASSQCPPVGPVLPAPRQPSVNKEVKAVVAGAAQLLDQLTTTYNATALSIGVQSIYESKPIINYHHTPKLLNNTGTHRVNIDTVYRLASISKMYTALAILQLEDQINIGDPVTRYVPELAEMDSASIQVNNITTVRWADVTIDALLSHLAGISEDIGDQDLANVPSQWTNLGLPKLPKRASAQCGATPTEPGCTKADLFEYIPKKHPVYAPYTTAMYSNNAFAILGLVIEAVTGKPYAVYMQEAVFEPLGLTQTYVGVPSDSSVGFIPTGSTWWAADLAVDNPSGGLYASTRDLLSIGKAILNFEALSSVRTRQWLKPATFTSSIGTFVGRPWEIARSDNVTSDKRVVDFYTKSGNLYDYSSILILIPDYGIVISVVSSGPDSGAFQVEAIASQLIWALLPAIEAAGKEEAKAVYPGTYKSNGSEDFTASIALAVDEGPGLRVLNYTSNGHDFLASYAQIVGSDVTPEVRLYPTDLTANVPSGQKVAWRAVYNTIPNSAQVDKLLFFPQGSCQTWSEEDILSYGLVALDDFVFTMNEDGTEAKALNARALRAVMEKVS